MYLGIEQRFIYPDVTVITSIFEGVCLANVPAQENCRRTWPATTEFPPELALTPKRDREGFLRIRLSNLQALQDHISEVVDGARATGKDASHEVHSEARRSNLSLFRSG